MHHHVLSGELFLAEGMVILQHLHQLLLLGDTHGLISVRTGSLFFAFLDLFEVLDFAGRLFLLYV